MRLFSGNYHPQLHANGATETLILNCSHWSNKQDVHSVHVLLNIILCGWVTVPTKSCKLSLDGSIQNMLPTTVLLSPVQAMARVPDFLCNVRTLVS